MFGFTALFGLGETVVAPTMGPLVSLTDNRVRGRVNSLSAFGQSLALIVCRAVATGLIAAGAAAAWIGLLCLGCLGLVAIGAVLRRMLTDEQDTVTPAPAVGLPAVPGRRRAPSPPRPEGEPPAAAQSCIRRPPARRKCRTGVCSYPE